MVNAVVFFLIMNVIFRGGHCLKNRSLIKNESKKRVVAFLKVKTSEYLFLCT